MSFKVLTSHGTPAPSFEAVMKKYGVNYQMTVGEGMFHCYPVFRL